MPKWMDKSESERARLKTKYLSPEFPAKLSRMADARLGRTTRFIYTHLPISLVRECLEKIHRKYPAVAGRMRTIVLTMQKQSLDKAERKSSPQRAAIEMMLDVWDRAGLPDDIPVSSNNLAAYARYGRENERREKNAGNAGGKAKKDKAAKDAKIVIEKYKENLTIGWGAIKAIAQNISDETGIKKSRVEKIISSYRKQSAAKP